MSALVVVGLCVDSFVLGVTVMSAIIMITMFPNPTKSKNKKF